MMWVEPSLIGQNWSLHYKKKCLKSSQPAFVCLSFYTCSKTKPRNCDIRMRRKKKTLQETSMSCKTLRHLKKKKILYGKYHSMSVEGPSYTMTDWHGEARASFDPNPLSCSRAKSFSGRDKSQWRLCKCCLLVCPRTCHSRVKAWPPRLHSSVARLRLKKGLTNDVYAVILDICWQNLSPVRHLEWN